MKQQDGQPEKGGPSFFMCTVRLSLDTYYGKGIYIMMRE